MRRELFTDDVAVKSAFAQDKGNLTVTNGKLEAAPAMLGEETVGIYHLDMMQPPYIEQSR